MSQRRFPCSDSLPPSPVDYKPIPLGVGQEPSPFADFEFSKDFGLLSMHQTRRSDGDWDILIRPPERPY